MRHIFPKGNKIGIGNTNRKTHGMYGTSTYLTYRGMLARCYYEGNGRYEDYGGAGITVCERWRESFENFFEDMGTRPKGKTLDRIDGTCGYGPMNCRWATKEEQDNNRRSTKRITISGETLSLTQWSRRNGLNVGTVVTRINRRGWSPERAVSEPLRCNQWG